jgi:hypothetical protein
MICERNDLLLGISMRKKDGCCNSADSIFLHVRLECLAHVMDSMRTSYAPGFQKDLAVGKAVAVDYGVQ